MPHPFLILLLFFGVGFVGMSLLVSDAAPEQVSFAPDDCRPESQTNGPGNGPHGRVQGGVIQNTPNPKCCTNLAVEYTIEAGWREGDDVRIARSSTCGGVEYTTPQTLSAILPTSVFESVPLGNCGCCYTFTLQISGDGGQTWEDVVDADGEVTAEICCSSQSCL